MFHGELCGWIDDVTEEQDRSGLDVTNQEDEWTIDSSASSFT